MKYEVLYQHGEAAEEMKGHPCFGGDRGKNGRIHLPVAPRCNIKCRYCVRKHDCVNESRPGLTSKVLTPLEALERLQWARKEAVGWTVAVAGIAGPGDPLANDETFETLRLVRDYDQHLITCLSTNGLLLPDKIGILNDIGLKSLTVTINAVDPEVGKEIYAHVNYNGTRYDGEEAAAMLIENQFRGIAEAVERGIVVKVNTVLIPGINEGQVVHIAERARRGGATLMNVMPLIPQGELAHHSAPSPAEIERVRTANEGIIPQMKHCRQCRADAVGLIGGRNISCQAPGADNGSGKAGRNPYMGDSSCN